MAATRARERLVVTAVKAPADDGDQPSRFLAELGVEPKDVTGRPRRPLVGRRARRRTARHHRRPARASDALREAAAQRLARLAALSDDDGPARWCPPRTRTAGGAWTSRPAARCRCATGTSPSRSPGSALDQLANTCSLQWFLGREVKADAPATAAQGFGNVVHVLADEVASGRTPADLAVLMERLDSVWDALAFDAPWKSRAGEGAARAPRWSASCAGTSWTARGRTPVASEHGFDVTLEAGDYEVRIRGSMDRVETGRRGPRLRRRLQDRQAARRPRTEVARHPQLAVYQLAVREGAVDEAFDGRRPEPGGAELVQLRQGAPQEGRRRRPAQGAGAGTASRGEWVGDLLATAAGTRPGRTVHPHHRPALHPLRLPGVVQRTARGAAGGGVMHAGVIGVPVPTGSAGPRGGRPRCQWRAG